MSKIMKSLLENETNRAYTQNSALAYQTTLNYTLDFFAKTGALRNTDEQEIIDLFNDAFNEDALITLKILFYIRDIRGGQGERRIFRIILKYLAQNKPDIIKKNLHIIAKYGRYDDMLQLLNTPLEKDLCEYFKTIIDQDLISNNPTLLAKWLPSINASKKSRALAFQICKHWNMNAQQYRQTLSKIRKTISIVESKMCNNEWSNINYENIPSCAMMKYRNAFANHDEKRYYEYISAVNNGEKTINSSILYPYDIINNILYDNINKEQAKALWSGLPDYMETDDQSLCIVDTSGSMLYDYTSSITPLSVAISLGIYMAERNKGVFKDCFMTFSDTPKLKKIKGKDIVEKTKQLSMDADWGGSTNIEAVFKLILKTAIKHNISSEDMIKRLYIISDMEFNEAIDYDYNETLFETIKRKYNNEGYDLPQLIFWNVNSINKQFPITKDSVGNMLVSGCSPSILKYTMKCETPDPIQLMLSVVNSDRYKDIVI